MTVLDRVKIILADEEYNESRIRQYVDTVSARLCLRLGVDVLPLSFQSICADAVVKMHRRYYYEGISSENDGGVSASFVDDVLAEYEGEIQSYKSHSGAVRFI